MMKRALTYAVLFLLAREVFAQDPLVVTPVLSTAPLFSYEDAPGTPDADDPAIWLNRHNPKNVVSSSIIATLLDMFPALSGPVFAALAQVVLNQIGESPAELVSQRAADRGFAASQKPRDQGDRNAAREWIPLHTSISSM